MNFHSEGMSTSQAIHPNIVADGTVGATMLNLSDVIDMCQVPAGKKIKLNDYPTTWADESDDHKSEAPSRSATSAE